MTNARSLDATVAADYVNRFTVGHSWRSACLSAFLSVCPSVCLYKTDFFRCYSNRFICIYTDVCEGLGICVNSLTNKAMRKWSHQTARAIHQFLKLINIRNDILAPLFPNTTKNYLLMLRQYIHHGTSGRYSWQADVSTDKESFQRKITGYRWGSFRCE